MVRGERRWFRSALGAVGALLTSSTLVVVVSGQPAMATVPGLPGEPQPGTSVFTEDFSNESAEAAPIRIGSYTGSPGSVYVPGPGGSGADSETYTADPAWSPGAGACNGWIMRSDSPLPPNGGSPTVTNNDQCGRSSAWARLQEMARDVGLFQGQSAAEAATNQILTEYTNSPTGAQAHRPPDTNWRPTATPFRRSADTSMRSRRSSPRGTARFPARSGRASGSISFSTRCPRRSPRI